MKFKVFFISIFLLHSSFSFADDMPLQVGKWIRAANNKTGERNLYFDIETIVKRDGRLFFWLMSNGNIGSKDEFSMKQLLATDCKKPVSYESLTKYFYKGTMASGRLIGQKKPEDKDKIQYPLPKSFYERVIDTTCKAFFTKLD